MKRLYYLIFGLFLVCVLITLLWAAKNHEETMSHLPDIVVQEINPLMKGNSILDIKIGAIEQRIKELQKEYPSIQEIIVRKIDTQGNVKTVYPYFNNMDQNDFPPERDESYYPRVLNDKDHKSLGVLYLRFDTRRIRLFNAAIVGSMIALIGVSIAGLYTIRTKEAAVRQTAVLLEEKQRELTRLERLSLVGQVTANLLHDLKKPVLNIRAEAETLPESESRKTILEETDLFLSLVRELHLEGFLRRDQEHAEFVDLHEILERSLRLVKYAQENVKVFIELPDTLPFLFGQRHQLVQVFSNILLNAFQALEGEGVIRIAATELREESDSHLEISLTDDGPGIPYEVLIHIFEPFFSTHKDAESTGLGLYITKTIIESMGGVIQAQSIPKHGTTFTIRLPLSTAEKTE